MKPTPRRLVLLRHGESEWNRDQRFTGWADVDLTELGRTQMREAGQALRNAGIDIDVVVTSVLKRAIHSAWLVLDAMDRCWVPVHSDWWLNERHYGGLTGLSKPEAIDRFGEDAVHAWRRGYDVSPPALDARAACLIPMDGRYIGLAPDCLPQAESLHQTAQRVQQAWRSTLSGAVLSGQTVLVVSHGNTLRAMTGLLELLSADALATLDVPNGVPIVYELNEQLTVLGKRKLDVTHATRSAVL